MYLINFVEILFKALYFAILVRVILSWFPVRPGNPFFPLAMIVHQITEPVLAPFRRIIPTIGMMDISPIVAMFVLNLVQQAVVGALRNAL